jgi:hypothetical protein
VSQYFGAGRGGNLTNISSLYDYLINNQERKINDNSKFWLNPSSVSGLASMLSDVVSQDVVSQESSD